MRKHCQFLGIFLMGLLFLSGCGKLDRKGSEPVNTPPTVYFADIPTDGFKFSFNPRIYWFGTDVDGFISAYQYAIMVTDSVVNAGGLDSVESLLHRIPSDSTAWVNQLYLKNIMGTHVNATSGHSKSILMYADIDPTIFTPQYIFLRAVDNSGVVSPVIHRMFYRNNHRPLALIGVDNAFKAKSHYCLEETTATWKGIMISWSGLDTADYKDTKSQPAFNFKWELLGPFEDTIAGKIDTLAVVDSSLDSIEIEGEWHYPPYPERRWVSDQFYIFKNLKNYGNLGYGWYQLHVRARDDAFVSTDTATILNFRIVKPPFLYAENNKKTILVVDATVYGGGLSGGVPDTLLVRPFYQQALNYLTQAGLCEGWRIWSDPNVTLTNPMKSPPGELVLSWYDLAIVLNFGSRPTLTNDNYKAYKEYLDIGGRIWLVGLNNFGLSPKSDGPKREPTNLADIRSSSPYTFEVATSYLGIDQVFVPGYNKSNSNTLEFIRAEPFGSWKNLPILWQDSAMCSLLKDYNTTDTLPADDYGIQGIPYVCYDALSNDLDYADRIPYYRRIYTFISYFGSTSDMHGRPCAVNYIGSTSRMMEFCFPLNLMKNDPPEYPVFKVMGEMVKWFWEDLP